MEIFILLIKNILKKIKISQLIIQLFKSQIIYLCQNLIQNGAIWVLGKVTGLNNKKNQDKNVISGNNFSNASKNSLIYSDKQLTVTIGIENLIVASFSDSLLVMDKKYSNRSC